MDEIPIIGKSNRAVRRSEAATGRPVSKAAGGKPPPISWVQTAANCESTAFGPWRIDVTELPSLIGSQPSYAVSIVPLDEKIPGGLNDMHAAKVLAVKFLALAIKSGLDSLVEHGIIGVKAAAK